MASIIRAASPHPNRDGHTGSIWQGGVDDLMPSAREPFDVIILCAELREYEYHGLSPQDIANRFRAEVHCSPNDDGERPFTREQATRALQASRLVCKRFQAGKKVLVSCMQGRNRSGLVSALALHRLYGMAGERCIKYIQNKRANALTNPEFNKFLDQLAARERQGVVRTA